MFKRICNRLQVDRFEYLYFLVMVVYMAQVNTHTGRMVGTLSGNPIPLLLPMVLTAIQAYRKKVRFDDRRLWILFGVIALWIVCIARQYDIMQTRELSFFFFLYYALIVAYVHTCTLGKRMLPLFEDIMTRMSAIAFLLWLIAVAVPSTANIFRQFEPIRYGNNIFYIFTWMDPTKEQVYNGLLRNAGFSWEPGRYAIMVVLALYCNLCRRGLSLKRNYQGWILLLSLASTLSTTGYLAGIVLYLLFFLKRLSLRKSVLFLFVFVPVVVYVSQLGFMQEKIEEQLGFEEDLEQLQISFQYNNEEMEEGEYAGSLDRFTAMYFERMNIEQVPWTGYGRNYEHSYFYQEISTNFVLTGGLLKLVGQHGIPLATLFYLLLLYSSCLLAKDFPKAHRLALFAIILIGSVSYVTFCVPVFTAFWFYFFCHQRQPAQQPQPA